MLDQDRVFAHFKTMSGLDGREAEPFRPFCEAAAGLIASRLRQGLNVGRHMDRLCLAAGAIAYSDWLPLGGSFSSANEIRVGEITLREQSGGPSPQGALLRERLFEDIADLLAPLPVLTAIRGEEG